MAKLLGRNAIADIATIVASDAIVGWHQRLAAHKSDNRDRGKTVGRYLVRREIVELVLRFARSGPRFDHLQRNREIMIGRSLKRM